MASRLFRVGIGEFVGLPSSGEIWRTVEDVADLVQGRILRLAVTGLSGGGKTVFITALVHHLLQGSELPFVGAVQERRLLGARLLPPRPGDPPPFPFATARATLADPEPRWPAPTEQLSAVRLQIRFAVKGLLRRRLGEHRTLNVQIIDYPGEWLLDLPLLELDYATWSTQMLDLAETPARAGLATEWRRLIAGLDPGAPADASLAMTVAGAYRNYLQRCRAAGLSLLQPGRFTMAAEPTEARLWFSPLPPGEPAPGGLRDLMAARYERYREEVVRPFYRDHFSRFDRQIVLVDLLDALNRGRACFDDLQATLELVLRSFRYGTSGLLTRLFQPRVERLLFAVSKADHVAHNQHHNLRLLLERLVTGPAGQARFEGVRPAFMALAAHRSTDVVRTEHHGQTLSCVRGVLVGKARQTILFPGEIPPDLPSEADWREGRFRFRQFAPRRLQLQGAEKPQHIRLDQAIEVLLGDRLQ